MMYQYLGKDSSSASSSGNSRLLTSEELCSSYTQLNMALASKAAGARQLCQTQEGQKSSNKHHMEYTLYVGIKEFQCPDTLLSIFFLHWEKIVPESQFSARHCASCPAVHYTSVYLSQQQGTESAQNQSQVPGRPKARAGAPGLILWVVGAHTTQRASLDNSFQSPNLFNFRLQSFPCSVYLIPKIS